MYFGGPREHVPLAPTVFPGGVMQRRTRIPDRPLNKAATWRLRCLMLSPVGRRRRPLPENPVFAVQAIRTDLAA